METLARLVILGGYVFIGYVAWKEGGEVKEWLIDGLNIIKEKTRKLMRVQQKF